MRAVLLVLACTACGIGATDATPGFSNGGGGGGGSGSGFGQAPNECVADTDCVLAASTCCECPTFALPAFANQAACGDVGCPPSTCADNVIATCQNQTCTLACKPLECDLSCPIGFVTDATGCLECACAQPQPNGCTHDTDCADIPADCCGCANGGEDIAILATDAATYTSGLSCPASPVCPGTDTCPAGVMPSCVQGRCELLTPADLTPQCGLPTDQPCPTGTVCMINAVDTATARAVGACLSP
jgi:hypothetical protein